MQLKDDPVLTELDRVQVHAQNMESELLSEQQDVIERIEAETDADGQITASDAAMVLQKTLVEKTEMTIETKTADWKKFIDVDGDKNITASDAAYILQRTLNDKLTLPVTEQTAK